MQVMMSGHAPSLASTLAGDPAFSAPGAPPPDVARPTAVPQQFAAAPPLMPNPPRQGPTYPLGMMPGPPDAVHFQAGSYGQQYAPPPGGPTGVKRDSNFHSVPPPKRADMQGEFCKMRL